MSNILETDVKIDRLLLMVTQQGAPKEHVRMLDNVFRPYAHWIDKLQAENANTGEVMDATTYLLATIVTELIVRTVPYYKPEAAVELVNEMFVSLSEDVKSGIENNFTTSPPQKTN